MGTFLHRVSDASRILPLVVFCLLSISCATRQSADTLRQQVATLQAENFQLRKEITEARVRLDMAREGTGQAATPAKGFAEIPEQGIPHAADQPALDTAPRVIYSEPIVPGPTPAVGPSGAIGASASGSGELMSLARGKLDAKDPEGALTVFRQIVALYPDDPLADDAQFGAGECFFLMGRYEEAIAEYRKVANGFPFGDQVPFAFLKIGFAHLALDQRDLALDNFRNVSEAFPGTEAATVARQQIAHLKVSGK